MKYRKLGSSDLEASSITLGTWVFGGECWGEVSDSESIRVVEEAIDAGINCIDTAPIYGSGRSEETIGKALKGKRDKVIIATKFGLEIKNHAIRPNAKASFIREEIENSLRRLNAETIDLYQCHWPDPNTSFKETFGELNKLKEEGKIRYIGVSNFDRKQLERASSISQVVTNQVQYSLFSRDIESDLFPACGGKVSILSYGSLGGGILTGKYKEPKTFPKGDVRNFFYQYYKEPFWSKAKSLVKTLEKLAEKRKVPTGSVAINWVLSHREVASCITGSRTCEQLRENAEAAGWDLTGEELEIIQKEYERIFTG